MTVAHVVEFDVGPDDRPLAHYDAVSARVRVEQEPPAGLLLHAAGFTPGGAFRIIDVWESEQDAQRFHDERLAPVLAALEPELAAPAEQRFESYELHHVVV